MEIREDGVKVVRFSGQTHYIYPKEVADEIGIEYKENWKDGEVGDWILCSDGYVAQVLRTGKIKHNITKKYYKWLRIATGTFPTTAVKIHTDERPDRYTFSGINSKAHLRNRKRLTLREMRFIRHYVKTGDMVKAYLRAFKTKNRNYAFKMAKKILRTERAWEMIKQEVQKALEEHGISYEYLVKKLKEIVEGDSKDTARLKAIEILCDISGINEKLKTEGQIEFRGFSRKAIEGFETEVKGRLKGKVEDG